MARALQLCCLEKRAGLASVNLSPKWKSNLMLRFEHSRSEAALQNWWKPCEGKEKHILNKYRQIAREDLADILSNNLEPVNFGTQALFWQFKNKETADWLQQLKTNMTCLSSVRCYRWSPTSWSLLFLVISGRSALSCRWKYLHSCYLSVMHFYSSLVMLYLCLSSKLVGALFQNVQFLKRTTVLFCFHHQGPSWWSIPRSISGVNELSCTCFPSARTTPTASSSASSCTAAMATVPEPCRSTSGSTGVRKAAPCGISPAPRGASGTRWTSLSALSGPANTRLVKNMTKNTNPDSFLYSFWAKAKWGAELVCEMWSNIWSVMFGGCSLRLLIDSSHTSCAVSESVGITWIESKLIPTHGKAPGKFQAQECAQQTSVFFTMSQTHSFGVHTLLGCCFKCNLHGNRKLCWVA